MRRVIFHKTTPWDRLFQSPHQFARQFAKNGWEVFYGETGKRKKWLTDEVEPGIHRIGRFSEFIHQYNIPFDLMIFGDRKAVNDQAFLKTNSNKTLWMVWDSVIDELELEPVANSLSDYVICASQAVFETRPFADGVVLNGVSESFALADCKKPVEFEGVDGPIITFIGYVGHWVDVEAIRMIAEKFNVFFIGENPYEKIDGVVDLGFVSHDKLKGYFKFSDVGIVPFLDGNEMGRCASPIKTYEYLATETPVVCSGVDEARNMPGVIHCDRETFIDSIKKALGIEVNPDEWKNHTWEKRFAQLMKVINES